MAQMHVSLSNSCGSVNMASPTNNFPPEATLEGAQLMLSSAALGLETLYDSIRQVYPQQPNPLQVTAFIKYW